MFRTRNRGTRPSYVGSVQAFSAVTINVSATHLTFTAQESGADPAVQSVFVTSRLTGAPMGAEVTDITYGGVQGWLAASFVTTGVMQAAVTAVGLPEGTYTATIHYTVPGATSPDRVITATFVVSALVPDIVMSFDPGPIVPAFGASEGGAAPADQVVSVRNQYGTLLADATVGTITAAWCDAAVVDGVVTIGATPGVLTPGTYPGTVEITSATAVNSPQTISVSLVIAFVNAPTIGVSDTTLDYATPTSGPSLPQSVTVSNIGPTGTLNLTAAVSYAVTPAYPWVALGAVPPTGGTLDITVLPSKPGQESVFLAAGTHVATVRLSSAGATNSPADITVTVVVTARPVISLVPPSVAVSKNDGAADPAAVVVNITNSGGGTLTPTVSAVDFGTGPTGWCTAVWDDLVPGTITVTVTQGVLDPGIYNCFVLITAPLAESSRYLPIYFTVVDVGAPPTPSPLDSRSTVYPYIPQPTNGTSILPRVDVDSRYDPGGVALTWASDILLTDTGNITTNTTNLQNAINDAAARVGHSRIRLPTGWRSTGQILLKKHTADSTAYTYIEWDGVNTTLPAGYLASPTQKANAPRFVMSANIYWQTREGADNYKLVGVAWAIEANTAMTYFLYINAIKPDPASGGGLFPGLNNQLTIADIPRNIGVDRCYFLGYAAASGGQNGIRNCYGPNGINDYCVDSWFEEVFAIGSESKCVAGGNGPGPAKFVGNFFGGGAIGSLIGGFTPTIAGMVPRDFTFRRNHYFKPDRWNKHVAGWDGKNRGLKNAIENKVGEFFLYEGNEVENVFHDGQIGNSILMKAENQGGSTPSNFTAHVTIRHNHCRKTRHGVDNAVINAHDDLFPIRNFEYYNNIFESFGNPAQGPAAGGAANIYFKGPGANDYLVRHNTFITTFTPQYGPVFLTGGPNGTVPLGTVVIKDNVFVRGQYGMWGSGPIPIPPPIEGASAYDTLQSSPLTDCVGNLFIGPGVPTAQYPAGNLYANGSTLVASTALVQFVDSAGGDYRLAASSPYKNAASDATDPGANIDDVDLACSGVRYIAGF